MRRASLPLCSLSSVQQLTNIEEVFHSLINIMMFLHGVCFLVLATPIKYGWLIKKVTEKTPANRSILCLRYAS